MKKSLAKLTMTPVEGKVFKAPPPSTVWYGVTWGCYPNDWSVRLVSASTLLEDNTMTAEIDFLMDGASYLLKLGTKFSLYDAYSFHCDVEIIQEIE